MKYDSRAFKIVIAGIAFLYLPLLLAVYSSFGEFRDTFCHYRALAEDSVFATSAVKSLKIATIAAGISVGISAVLAISMRNATNTWRVLLFSYTVLPDIVIALSLLNLFTALGIKLGFWTLVFSYTMVTMCFSTFYILQSFDVTKQEDAMLEEVAQDLGASKTRAVIHVLLPRVYAIVTVIYCYLVALLLDDVVLAGLLSGSVVTTAPIVILSMMRQGTDPRLNALATIILVVVLTIASCYSWLTYGEYSHKHDTQEK